MTSIVITGANRGIGLELARQRREEDVIALCRKSSPELDALGVRVEAGIDVGEDGCGAKIRERLGERAVDILINCAGILRRESLGSLAFDTIREQLEVNAIGPLRVTAALLPNMTKGSKVAMVTSRMGSIDDNTSGGAYGYRMSKAALNMAGVSLAHDLRGRGIAVCLLHPGFVRTAMTGGAGNLGPEESAAQLWERIDALDMSSTGTFWHANGEKLPW